MSAPIDLKEYEVIRSDMVAVSKILVDMWFKLGKPASPLTTSGRKMMDILIASWEDLFPQESKDWYAARKQYKVFEKTIHQQIKGRTGRSLASYPLYIFRVMKQLFPGFDPTKREICFKIIKIWPMFQFANKI